MVFTKIEIFHACLPEERTPEESAVMEFAQLARRRLESIPSSEDTNKVTLQLLSEESASALDSSSGVVFLFLVSCGPDGSVHRGVRKFIKKLKERTSTGDHEEPRYCIALLGHSVCKTSAEQMADQVFGPGRRMAKTLQHTSGCTPLIDTLETQIELVGPEEAFDGWIEALVNKLQ
jgi:hypothetical protein